MYRIVKMIRTDFFSYNIKFTKCVGKNSMCSKLKHNLIKKYLFVITEKWGFSPMTNFKKSNLLLLNMCISIYRHL